MSLGALACEPRIQQFFNELTDFFVLVEKPFLDLSVGLPTNVGGEFEIIGIRALADCSAGRPDRLRN
jgi:hypothetical protein